MSSFAVISFFYVFFVRLASIESRLVSLETKITSFWNWIDKELPHILHSPHTPDFDKLLDKWVVNRNVMTIKEIQELGCILREEISKTAKDKILLYVLMLGSVNEYLDIRLGNK